MADDKNYVLLLGAGFSRNWGGWLASEAFEYLIGCPGLNQTLRDKLWDDKKRGKDFEGTLADLQLVSQGAKKSEDLMQLEMALTSMFEDMNSAFDGRRDGLEFSNDANRTVTKFLSRFDAIFTLNQDLLLDRHYNNHNMTIGSAHSGWCLPGIRPEPGARLGSQTFQLARVATTKHDFKFPKNHQPVFKLHGSCNWFSEHDEKLLVMGGNKKGEIARHPILTWYSDQFDEYLSRPNTRLMVIGYSFRDDHINAVVQKSVADSNAALFLIDPLGVDIVDKNRGLKASGGVYQPDRFAEIVWPNVVGSSRRPLSVIFSNDDAEFEKVLRFFA